MANACVKELTGDSAFIVFWIMKISLRVRTRQVGLWVSEFILAQYENQRC